MTDHDTGPDAIPQPDLDPAARRDARKKRRARKARQQSRAARRALLKVEAVPRRAVSGDTNDPRTPPSAQGGWSERIDTLTDAVIVPSDGRQMVQRGGVYDKSGQFSDMAVLWRRTTPLLLPLERLPPVTDHLAGRWMWGGVLLNHFGHFLTESTTRLWALADLHDKLDGIVFLHKRNGETFALHQNFMAALGSTLPLRVIHAPTRLDVLMVPGQGFGLGDISFGTAKARAFFKSDFARDIKPDGPERLYVSRSALRAKRGGVLGETFIEDQLKPHGYEVFHPQQHPFDVQIARYRAARRIVALDGSALHLAAFSCAEDQHVAMIRRRSTSTSNAIGLHITGFTGRPPDVIDAIRTDWVVRSRMKADMYSMGELDMPQVQARLQAQGYIPKGGPDWPQVAPEWLAAEIKRLRTDMGVDFVPLPRPSGTAGSDEAVNE